MDFSTLYSMQNKRKTNLILHKTMNKSSKRLVKQKPFSTYKHSIKTELVIKKIDYRMKNTLKVTKKGFYTRPQKWKHNINQTSKIQPSTTYATPI